MSLAVFPFKSEEPSLVVSNLATAAAHPAIDEVWAVAPEAGGAEAAVRAMAKEVSGAHAKPVEVIIQERLGTYRSGKGDAMNTALALAAEQGRDRVHFYDADITNFDASWIDGAESSGRPRLRRGETPVPQSSDRRNDHLDDHQTRPGPPIPGDVPSQARPAARR